MENIETLLAAVAQTQGFEDDEPVVSTKSAPRLESPISSPAIPVDVGASQLVAAPLEVARDARLRPAVNRTPEAAARKIDQVIGAVEKKKRGRPSGGQFAAKPPQPKRKKQEDEEEEDVCFICFDGGSLVLCDKRGCPKAYHPSCIKRDEAFFQSKAKWNCGWHICSVCRKASHYMCYTCTYSLCKGCTKDADYLCVRGNKGFCTTCMKIITMIENKDQNSNDSAVQVDFDDITSWEYLFKMYWVILKEKLSLSMSELTKARKPWKGVARVASEPPLSNIHHSARDENVSIPKRSSEHLEMNKLQESQNERLMSAVSSIGNHIEKQNCNKEQDESIFSKDTNNGNTNKPSIGGNGEKVIHEATNDPVIEKDGDSPSKDRGEPRDRDRGNSDGLVCSVASDMEVNENSELMPINSKHKTCRKSEEREPQNNLSKYAAIDVHNINLIYLRRDMMESLIDDKPNFHDKVVGSIVRIRISSIDQKPDVYRLVKVVGTIKATQPYKIGDKTADIMLEVLHLDMKEVVSIDAISNQEFTEEECRQLHQSIKCGLLKQFTLDEIRKKAIALQAVRLNAWLQAEILQLNYLRDQASEKGCDKELREYAQRIQLLMSPEKYQQKIAEVPDVHPDLDISPEYESVDARCGDNSREDEHVRLGNSGPPQVEKPISPKEKGKEEGSTLAQSSMIEKIDASGSDRLRKQTNQVDCTNSAIGCRNDQAMLLSELETSAATVSNGNSLPTNIIETEKLWHHRDRNGKIQGPFSMMHLRNSSTSGLFPPDMRIWTNHEQYDSLLLTDALNGRFHGASEWRHDISSKSEEHRAINRNDGESKQKEVACCSNASVLSEKRSGSGRENESSWPQCWDLLKDNDSNADNVTARNLLPSSSIGQMFVALPDRVQETNEFDRGPRNTDQNTSNRPTLNEKSRVHELQNSSYQENRRPLPIDLSLNDIASGSVSAPVSKSPDSIKQEADIGLSSLPSTSTLRTRTTDPVPNKGILELLSPTPRSNNENQEAQATETKQSGLLPNFPVSNSGPSWTNASNLVFEGWDPDLVSAPPLKPHEEVTGNDVATSDTNQLTHVSPSNIPNWLAMMNEPIEFDALGEESVSDLLAEVDAMESQGVFPSPTSSMKFAKEMQDCKDDCFSSIEEFTAPAPGKSDAFSSTSEIHLNCHSSVPSRPIDALDSFSRSDMQSSGSSAGENNAPAETGSGFHRPAPINTSHDVAHAIGPDYCIDPGWGTVQGNINLVTVQGNVNLVLGGPAQGMANLNWGTNPGSAWVNPSMNQSPINGSLPWDGQRKYGFSSPREWGCYQGGDPGFGRGRQPWGRPPYGGGGGGGGGGYSRPPPKGQRVCKFYESGRCKKGAFCDYLHP